MFNICVEPKSIRTIKKEKTEKTFKIAGLVALKVVDEVPLIVVKPWVGNRKYILWFRNALLLQV